MRWCAQRLSLRPIVPRAEAAMDDEKQANLSKQFQPAKYSIFDLQRAQASIDEASEWLLVTSLLIQHLQMVIEFEFQQHI